MTDIQPQPSSDRGGSPPRYTAVAASPADDFEAMLAFIDGLDGPRLRALLVAINLRLLQKSDLLWTPSDGDSEVRP